MYKIGEVIDPRSDGSYIYMSHKGVLNLDNSADLNEARKEDDAFLTTNSKESYYA